MDDNLSVFGKIVETVRPLLHHAAALGKMSASLSPPRTTLPIFIVKLRSPAVHVPVALPRRTITALWTCGAGRGKVC